MPRGRCPGPAWGRRRRHRPEGRRQVRRPAPGCPGQGCHRPCPMAQPPHPGFPEGAGRAGRATGRPGACRRTGAGFRPCTWPASSVPAVRGGAGFVVLALVLQCGVNADLALADAGWPQLLDQLGPQRAGRVLVDDELHRAAVGCVHGGAAEPQAHQVQLQAGASRPGLRLGEQLARLDLLVEQQDALLVLRHADHATDGLALGLHQERLQLRRRHQLLAVTRIWHTKTFPAWNQASRPVPAAGQSGADGAVINLP